jgi:hypothetical protein
MKRLLTKAEHDLIRLVADKLPADQRKQLLDDAIHATAESAVQDGSRVLFHIQGYERPPYRGQHSFGVQGELLDDDEVRLSFDLFADENGRLLELEIIRWDETPLIKPNWSTIKMY